ncbi:MAG TPA: GGDEF domain-containing response regulator [Gemmatimonadaceae bacterium]|nr:GGDEF domain-containing response regulator [Gemmatimonadaceae bacterium]
MADARPLTVLLIEDDPADIELLRSAVAQASEEQGHDARLELECADRVSTGLCRLADGGIDVILLELSLPDGDGLETLERLREHGPDLPVVVLTALDDENLGLQALRIGAQDYLIKGRVTHDLVLRAVRYARERHKMQATLRSLALIDPLTGLHNRRGFFTLAEQQLKIAQRTGRGLILLLGDVDGLKTINDTHGHQAGDVAVMESAAALRATLRRSDVIARLGGDEFAMLALDAPPSVAELIVQRIQQRLKEQCCQRKLAFELNMSIGTAPYDSQDTPTLDHLLAQADQELYRKKPHNRHQFRERVRT